MCLCYIAGRLKTLDEATIHFTGHWSIKVYNPSKPSPYGIKVYCINDINGVLLELNIYAGKTCLGVVPVSPEPATVETECKGLTDAVVRTLIEPYRGTGDIICFDNYYTNVGMFIWLLSVGIFAMGTVRTNRACLPKEGVTVPKKAKRGEWATWIASLAFLGLMFTTFNLVFSRFIDNKAVFFLSTLHTNPFTNPRWRWNKADKQKVDVAMTVLGENYNAGKCGTDLFDQMMAAYPFKMKTLDRPYMYIWYWLLCVTIVNSWMYEKVWRATNSFAPRDQFNYRLTLVKALIVEINSLEPPTRIQATEPAASAGASSSGAAPGDGWISCRVPVHGPIPAAGPRLACVSCAKRMKFGCHMCRVGVCMSRGLPCWLDHINKEHSFIVVSPLRKTRKESPGVGGSSSGRARASLGLDSLAAAAAGASIS